MPSVFTIKGSERIPGGKARDLDPRRYDARQLKVGVAIEMEHTNSRRVAREIAMDHLVEDGCYYFKLCRWHHESACKLLKGRRCKRRR